MPIGCEVEGNRIHYKQQRCKKLLLVLFIAFKVSFTSAFYPSAMKGR